MPTVSKKSSQQITLDTQNGPLTFTYDVRRSSRARHLRINFDYLHNQLFVTLPPHSSLGEAKSFIVEKREWIAKHINRLPPSRNLYTYLQQKPHLSLNGKQCNLTIEKKETHPQALWNDELEEVKIIIHPEINTNRQLKDLLQNLARKALVLRTHDLISYLQILMPRVTVRNQKTRWGSCSNVGTLSLNWRLILLEPHHQDHVIFHELAHLAELNHSQRFWDLLRSYNPNTDQDEAEIDKIARIIMPLGHD